MNLKKVLYYLPRIVAAIIMLQTLYFKFTGHPSSIHIFEAVGLEPVGRIGTGVLELVASLLLLYRPVSWIGAGLAMGLMSGAIFSHLGPLGIDVLGDGGALFGMAVAVFVSSAVVLYQERENFLSLFRKEKLVVA